MAEKTIYNPDKARIYHCWHWCDCGKTWTHSQGDWEAMKRHVSNRHRNDWSVIHTAPSDYQVAQIIVGGR